MWWCVLERIVTGIWIMEIRTTVFRKFRTKRALDNPSMEETNVRGSTHIVGRIWVDVAVQHFVEYMESTHWV